ncbi:hypothetical protein EG352_00915 [Chryseobacterium indologenes]|uniref:Uncharacterized protein n=1 Tax=Chryseobacterium indologenes TaxID=253 RepID=A0AAD1DTU7_CHRID|nr:hypothetical protein CEQ15_04115 [Chryseobacterium indologenes]AZB16439.1 hypothetical protein EG352_00915 [Chryseobacterium indologenes]
MKQKKLSDSSGQTVFRNILFSPLVFWWPFVKFEKKYLKQKKKLYDTGTTGLIYFCNRLFISILIFVFLFAGFFTYLDIYVLV